MKKHILMVVTTADKINDDKGTGIWLSEFGEPYMGSTNKTWKNIR